MKPGTTYPQLVASFLLNDGARIARKYGREVEATGVPAMFVGMLLQHEFDGKQTRATTRRVYEELVAAWVA